MNELIDKFLGNGQVLEGLVGGIGLLLTLGVAFLVKYVKQYVGNEKLATTINELVEESVFKTFDTFVKDIKASREDGKLNQAERAKAFNMAKNYLLTTSKQKGIDLGKKFAEDKIKALIEGAVQRSKTGDIKVNGATIAERLKERK